MKRLAGLLLALGLGLLPACDEPVTYTYFVIEAKIDPDTVDLQVLNRIVACAMIAETPKREDSADLRCKQRLVGHDLGKAEYTTSLTSGTIKFVVIGNDFNQKTLVQGETTVEIMPGKILTATVIAKPTPGALPDSGVAPVVDSGASD